MDKIIRKTVLIGSMALLAGAASASDIYKHVDADGNISYGDRPSGAPAEQRVNVVSRATTSAQVQASVDRTLALEEQSELRREEREAKKAAQREQAQAAADRASKCSDYRQKMLRYSESRRLYRVDENGERVFLDDSEREKETQHMQGLINEFCS